MSQNSLQLLLPFISAVAGVLATTLAYRLIGRRRLRLAHRHRIIEENIKRIHKYAEEYYIPYISLSETVAGKLAELQKSRTKDKLEISFFRLAQWFHMQYKCWKGIGGIVTLGNLTAECLLKQFQAVLPNFFDEKIGIVERHSLMNVFECEPQVGEFFNKFRQKLDEEPLGEIFKKYDESLTDPEISSLVTQVDCFHRLFQFEINMCYEPWYGRKPVRPKVDFSLVTERLNELIRDHRVTLREANGYLRRL